ncbi:MULTISPECIES: DUF551 domain-containing protein [unclassified Burkholderia]|uniref:DUF551 domain-containing protein n=1 Tax=unclassified Burkholderia TaxID=2613784 RepID=UPI000A44E52D|nr:MULTISPECIES: DUF551 domain-containing protein [unclassified Burkholderia]
MNDQQQSRADALTDRIDSAMDLAHRWATATYYKGLSKPYENFDKIRRQLRSTLRELAASSIEQPTSLTAQDGQPTDWRGDFERQANAAGFDLSREEFGGEYCHPDSADAFRWYYTGRLDEACSGTPSSQLAAAPIGYCERTGGCVCGGDLPRVREGCSEWVKVESQAARATTANETGAEGANWIPVSRKLPARGEGVLVAVQFDHADDWRMKVGGLSDEGTWTVFGASWTPSHWMPLPPPPRASTQPAMAAASPADHISQAGKMVSAEVPTDERAARLDDADIDAIAESMPGGLVGFKKHWGWRQFARAIEDEVLINAARAAVSLADEHSTIECQAHSGPDCTECGGTGVWSGTANERAEFEAWAYEEFAFEDSDDIDVCARDKSGYHYANVDSAWAGWQARAAASPAAEAVIEAARAVLREELDDVTVHPCDQRDDDAKVLRLPEHMQALYMALKSAPQPAQADALEEEAYVAKRMAETLATVYATIIGDDPVDADDSLNAIERVMRAAQVLRLEVDLYRAQADAPLPRASGAAEPMTTEQRKALADAERVLAENWEHETADLLHDAFAASVAPAHTAECPHCDGEGVIEADSGASPCACAQDAQEGMQTFGARWTQADAPTGRVVSVSDHVWHGYCAILAILGMEDAGDPVAEVERLKAQADAPAEARV